MKRLVILVSGGGSNLQSIIDAVSRGEINTNIAAVIADRRGAFALERAKNFGIPAIEIDRWDKELFPQKEDFARKVAETINEYAPDLIVLVGYLSILPPETTERYKNRVINIHPSLIPKFCGMGFYGMKVHEAVLAADETESGATVHYVDEGVDTGGIILQEKVPIVAEDTAETLAARVLEVEHKIIVEAIRQLTMYN
jgi:phosphoribosylglycinamide formyltransferase-1